MDIKINKDIAKEYPDVTLDYMYVDNCAMDFPSDSCCALGRRLF